MKSYLIGSGAERAVLLGGYVLERAGEDGESLVELMRPVLGPRYEQLKLLEAFEQPEANRYRLVLFGPSATPGALEPPTEQTGTGPMGLLDRHVAK